QAITLFEEAVQVSKSIEDESSKATTLGIAGRNIAQSMRDESGAESSPPQETLLRQILHVAEGIQDSRWKAIALRDVAASFAQAGIGQQVNALFDRAVQTASSIQDGYMKAVTVQDIGAAILESGNNGQAIAAFQQAMRAAASIDNPTNRAAI